MAEALIGNKRGRPPTASCGRAISSIYYALFHTLARDCADLLIGSTGANRSDEAWRQVYRSLDHGPAKERCRSKTMMARFPRGVGDFADLFIIMQEKRHAADYDPGARFIKSDVIADLAGAKQGIAGYRKVPSKHRRAFCAYVLLRQRPG